MIKKLLPILSVTFIDIIGFSILIPILPYFATHFGVSAFVVTVLFSTFSCCQLVSAMVWGNISDRIGRKAVLIISQIGATIGWGMLAFAPNIGWVFFWRIIEGLSGGNISVTQAYVADLVEAKDRSRAFGLIGAMFGAGMVCGPVMGSILFAKFGYPAPFLAAAFLQFLTLIVTVVMLPESRTKIEDEEHVAPNEMFKAFLRPHLRPILFQKLAIALTLYGWFGVAALYLKGQLGFTLEQTYVFFSAFAVLNVFCNVVLVGAVSKRLGDRAMCNVGLACLVVGFGGIPFVHNVAMLAINMSIFSIGMALTNSGITAIISNASTDREQGTVLGTSSALDSLAGIVAPPGSGGLLTLYGPRLAGAESLFFAAIAFAMGVFTARGERQTSGDGAAAVAADR
jgi:MFS family permease